MNIAIIGTGTVGAALGSAFAKRGHAITFGARDPGAERISQLVRSCGTDAAAAIVEECHADADVVVLAVPGNAAVEIARNAGDLSGKVLVDANNPIGQDMWLFTDGSASLAEQIAEATGARVVKAFNTIGMSNLGNLDFEGSRASGFICGDDAESKEIVGGLAAEIGFDVVDCGPLQAARLLEPMAMLWVRLAYVEGNGPEIAFRLLRR